MELSLSVSQCQAGFPRGLTAVGEQRSPADILRNSRPTRCYTHHSSRPDLEYPSPAQSSHQIGELKAETKSALLSELASLVPPLLVAPFPSPLLPVSESCGREDKVAEIPRITAQTWPGQGPAFTCVLTGSCSCGFATESWGEGIHQSHRKSPPKKGIWLMIRLYTFWFIFIFVFDFNNNELAFARVFFNFFTSTVSMIFGYFACQDDKTKLPAARA